MEVRDTDRADSNRRSSAPAVINAAGIAPTCKALWSKPSAARDMVTSTRADRSRCHCSASVTRTVGAGGSSSCACARGDVATIATTSATTSAPPHGDHRMPFVFSD